MTEIIIGGLFSALLGGCAYFFQKWLATFEDKFNEKFSGVKSDIAEVKDELKAVKEIAEATRAHVTEHPPPDKAVLARLENLETVKEYLSEQVVPRIKEIQSNFGKITVLETKNEDLENKVLGIFKAVERLASIRKKPQE